MLMLCTDSFIRITQILIIRHWDKKRHNRLLPKILYWVTHRKP